MTSPNVIIKRTFTPEQNRFRRLKSLEHPGRVSGKLAGTHVDELGSLRKLIQLCWACKPKFNYKAYRYFYEHNIRGSGRCDGCDEIRHGLHLFIHESTVVQNRKSRHGDSWLPQ